MKEGLAFREIFEGADHIQQLRWDMQGSKCEMYMPGDGTQWCRCTAVVQAAPREVFESLWDLGNAHVYREPLQPTVIGRPTLHSVNFTLSIRVMPLVAPIHFYESRTWALVESAGKKEYCIVSLPTLGSEGTATTRQLILLSAGAEAQTTRLVYIFNNSIDVRTLARMLPKPRAVVLEIMRGIVEAVQEHHEQQWRQAFRSELATIGGLERLGAIERQRIEEGLTFKAIFGGTADVQQLRWRLPGSTCEIVYVPGDSNPWCKCTTVVPADPVAVLEGIWEINSPQLRYHDRVRFSVLGRPGVHSAEFSLTVRVTRTMKPFRWQLSGTWASSGSAENKEYYIAFLPSNGNHDDGSAAAHASTTRQFVQLSHGPDAAHTTALTYLFQINFGARLAALERIMPSFRVVVVKWHRQMLRSIKLHYKKHRRAWLNDVEHDREARRTIIDRLITNAQAYSEDEHAAFDQALALLDLFDAHNCQAKQLKLGATIERAQTKVDRSGTMVGEAEAIVRGASAYDIVAYLMDFNSKFIASITDTSVYLRWETLELKNDHHRVVFFEFKAPPFHNRAFLQSLLCKKLSDEQYLFVTVPVAHHPSISEADEHHSVRGEIVRCIRLTSLPGDATKLEFAFSADLQGHFPKHLTNAVVLPQMMGLPYTVQRYFLRLRPGDACTAEDGTVIAHMVMDVAAAAKKDERPAAVAEFIQQTAMLCDTTATHLATIVQHLVAPLHANIGIAQNVATDNPASLTEAEAAHIGKGFASIVLCNTMPEAAVDEFLRKYAAMRVLMEAHAWMRPLLLIVAKRQMVSTPMGLKLRVAAGALLSLADVGSDLYMIIQFLQNGETAAAYGMIGTVAVNLMLQTVLVVYQHKHRGWWAVGREVGFCVCFLKPGVDAFRVASGHLQATGTPVDAMAEMTISKVVEMVTESTPSALLQTATALGSRTRSWATIGSIIFSCLATAFTALTIAWDFETHPMKRRNNPEFYGYLPDDPGRATVIFLLMFILHATLVIGKIFAMALLVLTDWHWLAAYLAGDMTIYIVYKVLRGDLYYFVPGMGLPLSFLCRVIVKVFVDFSACIHFRNPHELGGVYYIIHAVMGQLACIVSAVLYSMHYAGEGKLGDAVLYPSVCSLTVAWIGSLSAFLMMIKPEYIRTFVSLQSGCDYSMDYFRKNEDNDAKRVEVFFDNERKWKKIRPEVKQWVLDNYADWASDQPLWFTEDVKARIPSDFIPSVHLIRAAPAALPPNAQS